MRNYRTSPAWTMDERSRFKPNVFLRPPIASFSLHICSCNLIEKQRLRWPAFPTLASPKKIWRREWTLGLANHITMMIQVPLGQRCLATRTPLEDHERLWFVPCLLLLADHSINVCPSLVAPFCQDLTASPFRAPPLTLLSLVLLPLLFNVDTKLKWSEYNQPSKLRAVPQNINNQ